MRELLYVLFYQAIVAVNVAVILNAIVWLAKRKDEKDERKPNPDFTPPPEKKPPCKFCRFYVSDEQSDKCGFCGKNDEIVGAYDRKGCFEKKLLCGDCQFFVPTEEKSAELPFSNGYCGRSIHKDRVRRTQKPCNGFQIRTSEVKPKPVEKTCDNCDYSFAKGAKHPGCIIGALGFPCGSFKPIARTAKPTERPASLGTVTVGGKKK